MMDNGQPDQKRPRIGSWSTQQSRELPQLPPPAATFQHGPPFPRPEPQPHLLDTHRRHSEHGQYDSGQSGQSSGSPHVYRPGPQHPPAPPYNGPRDTMIKRDPSDEPLPPQYRPPATGPAPDHAVAGADRFHHPHLDPSPTVASTFRAPFPPQSPMAGPEPYVQYNGFPAQPREAYHAIPYSSTAAAANAAGKKKAQRASQACDSCRTLKAKCDEGRPTCGSCRDKGGNCVYRDPPAKQVDKTSSDILAVLERVEKEMKTISGRLSRLEGNHREESRSGTEEEFSSFTDARFKQELLDDALPLQFGQQANGSPSPPPPRPAKSEFAIPATPRQYNAAETVEDAQNATPAGPITVDDQEEEEEAGEEVRPGKPSFPVNHTTPAARLLLEPAIAKLASGIILPEKIKYEKYPILQEAKRGVIRLYGRGEGVDRPPGYEKEPLIDYGSEPPPYDVNFDAPSPAGGEEWGQVGGLTPGAEDNSPLVPRGNVIDIGGMPDFNRDKVWRYVASYNKNLNNIHPILIPRRLNALVEVFLKSIPGGSPKSRIAENLSSYSSTGRGPTASFVGSGRNPESPGQKRKRSVVTTAENPEVPNTSDLKPGRPFRSISTALVLLVMALGEICEHKTKIPDISYLQNDDQLAADSPQMRNGHPRSPVQTSPPLSTSTGLPSPQDGDRMHSRSRRTSSEGGPYFVKGRFKRNLDIIPGLSYFALATDILGNQNGGNSLQHVHANILASLYHGQLGRVLESHSYIHNACRALQHILRPKLDRLQKLKRKNEMIEPRDNPIVFAFWTCLQLESDILAELPYPPSGILTYEEDMPPPNLQAAKDDDKIDDLVLESYSAQLYLRKHLNMLHAMFYNPEDTQSDKPSYIAIVKACEDTVNNIQAIAPNLKWDETSKDDLYAKDILGARLRAKIYGARVITYRDFVLKILQRSSEDSNQDQHNPNNITRTLALASNADTEIEPIIIQYAELCIKALIKSTMSFYGLGDPSVVRLLVTNIWGTAHAQWGNILTLQAAYMDPILSRFVDADQLKALLSTTLGFLRLHAHRSSALYIDYRILQHTGKVTGLLSDKDLPSSGSVNSSFGSQPSEDVPMTRG